MDRERRIPPFAEDALEVLNEAAEDTDDAGGDGLPKDDAKAVLAADDRFTGADAERALDVLHNRGHIYYTDDRVRITPTDD